MVQDLLNKIHQGLQATAITNLCILTRGSRAAPRLGSAGLTAGGGLLCARSPAEAVAGGAPVAVLRDGADRAVLDGAGPGGARPPAVCRDQLALAAQAGGARAPLAAGDRHPAGQGREEAEEASGHRRVFGQKSGDVYGPRDLGHALGAPLAPGLGLRPRGRRGRAPPGVRGALPGPGRGPGPQAQPPQPPAPQLLRGPGSPAPAGDERPRRRLLRLARRHANPIK